MENSDRIDNPEVREYLYQYVPKRLNSIPLFVKVFGGNFAEKRLRTNVIAVYTNQSKGLDDVEGYQSSTEKSITFCQSGKDGALLTPEEMVNDEKILEVALHECIHAILTRSEKECKEFNISGGTGILERYQNFDTKGFSEIGRGLNEGFTEWLCEKAGFKTLAYDELTDFVRLLEAAIGTENVMKLGKGGINQNFSQILNMPQEEVNYLLGLSDHLYKVHRDIVLIRNLIKVLSYDEEEMEKYSYYIEYYQKDPVYLDYIKKNGLDNSVQSVNSFLKEVCIKELENQKNDVIINFESKVLDKYFTKDIMDILESDDISEENFRKCQKIVSLLNSNSDKKNDSNMSSIIIKEKYEIFVKKYIEKVAKEQFEKFNCDTLGLEDFFNKIKSICGDNYELECMFLEKFSESVNEDFKIYINRMISTMYNFYRNGNVLENIDNMSIYKLIPKDHSKNLTTTVIYDKKHFAERFGFNQQIIKKDSKEGVNFDFTMYGDFQEEYEIAMKNFLKLKEDVFRKNPNSKIHVSSRAIVVEGDDEPHFYVIDAGEVVPMDIQNTFNVKFSKKEKTQEKVALLPVKVNFWSKFTNKLRRAWNSFKNRNKLESPPNYQDNDTGQIVFNTSSSSKKTIDSYIVENFDEKLTEKFNQKSNENISQNYQENIENEK